jgi:hypothetical protein
MTSYSNSTHARLSCGSLSPRHTFLRSYTQPAVFSLIPPLSELPRSSPLSTATHNGGLTRLATHTAVVLVASIQLTPTNRTPRPANCSAQQRNRAPESAGAPVTGRNLASAPTSSLLEMGGLMLDSACAVQRIQGLTR